MGDYTHTGLNVVGLHVPDAGSGPYNNMQEALAAGHDTLNPETGMYVIGVEIDGAFVPLIEEKASLVFDRIRLAQQQQQQAQQAQQQQTQTDTSGQQTQG